MGFIIFFIIIIFFFWGGGFLNFESKQYYQKSRHTRKSKCIEIQSHA